MDGKYPLRGCSHCGHISDTAFITQGIPNDRKECIRSFLVHVNAAILKKASRGFNFKRASIGNLFLAGASLFLGSLSSAIFLFGSITDIPHDVLRVVPVIQTSSTATIAALLVSNHGVDIITMR